MTKMLEKQAVNFACIDNDMEVMYNNEGWGGFDIITERNAFRMACHIVRYNAHMATKHNLGLIEMKRRIAFHAYRASGIVCEMDVDGVNAFLEACGWQLYRLFDGASNRYKNPLFKALYSECMRLENQTKWLGLVKSGKILTRGNALCEIDCDVCGKRARA